MGKFLILLVSVLLMPGLAYCDVENKGEADNILGFWTTAEGKSKVEIYRCGDKYCGKITWLKIPLYEENDPQGMAGQVKVDRENPDPGMKKTPLVGLVIIRDFIYDGESEWSDGSIYDPQNGKTYSCNMTLTDQKTLEVRGYVGIPLFGRTAVWTR